MLPLKRRRRCIVSKEYRPTVAANSSFDTTETVKSEVKILVGSVGNPRDLMDMILTGKDLPVQVTYNSNVSGMEIIETVTTTIKRKMAE